MSSVEGLGRTNTFTWSPGNCSLEQVRLNIADSKQVAAFPGQIAPALNFTCQMHLVSFSHLIWQTDLPSYSEVGVVGRSGMTGNTFHVKEFVPGSTRGLKCQVRETA